MLNYRTPYIFNTEDIYVIEKPTELPVSIDDVKTYIRVDGSDEDALIFSFIESALNQIDGPTGIGYALMTQKWRYKLPHGSVNDGCDIVLQGKPVITANGATLTYTPPAGPQTTLDLTIDSVIGEGYIFAQQPATGWPKINWDENVYIDYSLGHTTVDDIPSDIKIAIYAMCNMYYSDRSMEAEKSPMISAILNKYKTMSFDA